MRRTCCVLFMLLLLPGATEELAAQQVGGAESSGQRASGFTLEQNRPNPFNPETRIPFVLDETLFVDGRPAVVSIRIFNALQQFVATPTALNHAMGQGVDVVDLEYRNAGRFEAYWDGRDRRGDSVASGIYFLQLIVNGKSQIRRMLVAK
ncbi:MAG: hypothetical protein WDZ89_00675 [Gemmatimonadota bacterium]